MFKHLCKICGEEAVGGSEYCAAHQPRSSRGKRPASARRRKPLIIGATVLVWLVALGVIGGAVHGRIDRARAAMLTPTLTRTVRAETPTATPTVTPTPSPTLTPKPTSTPKPTPTPTPINPAVAAELSADDIAILAALIRSEAGGMQVEGKYLVACNVLADFYLAEGDWDSLIGRWAPLDNILDGNMPITPQGEDFTIANGAADGDVCLEYPRCRFLGAVSDVHVWQANEWVEPGRYDLWLGPGGGMMVCILSTE